MSRLSDGIFGMWQRTSMMQRFVLVAVLCASLGACWLLFGWMRKPDMTVLYSQLAPEEAAKVVEKIRESGVAYELKDGGTSVYVASDKVYETRLAMASQGLPKDDQAGYRILDEEKIGISPFSQRVNYMRAVEGELSKTIRLLDGVVSSRVHIVCPEDGIFAGKDRQASATVVLRLKPGRRLAASNVAAIVHLLSGSVEGLTPQRVVVVDSQGTLLSTQDNSEMANKAGTFWDYKSRVEDDLARKAEDVLAAALGPGRASVRVDAVIDTLSMDTTSETYNPEGKVVVEEDIKSMTASAPAGGGGASKEENTNSKYLVGKTVKRESDLPGKIKSLTVAALVDLSAPPAPKDAAATPAAPATKITVKDAEDIIRNAMGLRPNDTLKVVDTPFYKPAAAPDTQAEDQKQASRDFYLEIARRSSLGVLVVGLLVALKILSGGKRKGAAGSPALAGAGIAGALEGSGAIGALPAGGDMDPEALRSRITRALQENPEEVKKLFLSWVDEKEEV